MKEADKFKVYRYMYSIGEPVIDDLTYDTLLKDLQADEITGEELKDYFNRLYDEDPIPEKELREYFNEEEANLYINMRAKQKENLVSAISESDFMSKSIKSERTLEDCYPWINAHKHLTLCVSSKIDGINVTAKYVPSSNGCTLSTACSKGKNKGGRSLDYTQNVKRILPNNLSVPEVIIVGEAVGKDNPSNPILLYSGSQYASQRGMAYGLLVRNDLPTIDYKDYLHMLVFRTSYGDNTYDSIEYAKSLGFETVPHGLYKFSFTTYEEYVEEITTLINTYRNLAETELGFQTDGIVLEVNDRLEQEKEVNDTLYNGSIFAVKALGWESSVYVSTVEDISVLPAKFQYNCIATVTPVYTSSGKKLQKINFSNLNRVIESNVHIGDHIKFEYVNETTINFIEKLSISSEDKVNDILCRMKGLSKCIENKGILYTDSVDQFILDTFKLIPKLPFSEDDIKYFIGFVNDYIGYNCISCSSQRFKTLQNLTNELDNFYISRMSIDDWYLRKLVLSYSRSNKIDISLLKKLSTDNLWLLIKSLNHLKKGTSNNE